MIYKSTVQEILTAYDVDESAPIGNVIKIDTDTGDVFLTNQENIEVIKYKLILAIKNTSMTPNLFHCYGRIVD